jgi:hypothetical protein
MKGFNSREQLRKLYQMIPARMKDAVARGGPPIGGKVPLGYARELSIVDGKPVAKLVPDPVTGPLVAEAFKLFAEGASSRGVANFLISHGIPMLPANVRRVFQNTRYTGANVVGKKRVKKRRTGTSVTRMDPSTWTIFEGAHEPLVDRELFERVQARLVTGSITSTRTREQHPENPFPQGIIRCAKCNSNVEFHKSQKGNYVSYTFTCRRRRERGAAHDDIGCAGSISVERLRRKVLAHISYLMRGDTLRDMFASYKPKPNPEIRRLENVVKTAEKRRDKLLEAIENADGSTLTLVQQMERRVPEIEEAQRTVHLLRAVEPVTVDPASIRTDARSIAQSLLKMDNVKSRSLIGHVFSEIRVDFGAAAALRDAYRTLKASFRNKTDAEIFDARFKAAQIADKIQWTIGGDVTFAYTWGGPILTGAENLLNMAEGRLNEVTLGKPLPDDIVEAAAANLT